MSGELCHHSDEATGPESCGWIKRHRKKYRYYLEQTSASALRGSYAPGLQKQSSMYLDSADVVRDVETSPLRSLISIEWPARRSFREALFFKAEHTARAHTVERLRAVTAAHPIFAERR